MPWLDHVKTSLNILCHGLLRVQNHMDTWVVKVTVRAWKEGVESRGKLVSLPCGRTPTNISR